MCHFLIQVKRNCSKLYSCIQLHCATHPPISTFKSCEKRHGRVENRHIELFVSEETVAKDWKGIKRLVKVSRWGKREGKAFSEVSYYILSKPIDCAQTVASGIRNHWGIENLLHGIKDVLLKEDDNGLRQPKPATAVAFLNTYALNVVRLAGYKPGKDSVAFFTNKIKELFGLLTLKSRIKRT